MKISGSREMGITAGAWNMAQGEDAVSKSLRKQIASAQKALQELSADKELTVEEKMKRRQELQQQITNLNQQLRQHQIERRRELQQDQKEAAENRNSGNHQKKDEQPGQGLSRIRMEAMVSADSAMKQAKTYGGVYTRLKGEKGTLGSEISLDQKRGQNVEDKVKKLAEIEKRMEKAAASQADTLVQAGKEMKRAGEKEREEKTDNFSKEKSEEELRVKEESEEELRVKETAGDDEIYTRNRK